MQQLDVLLLPLLRPLPPAESESHLARLIADATPIIKGIIGNKLQLYGSNHSHEAEDVCADVIVQLLARLRSLVSNPEENSISDFRGYVAVTAYNACNLYLRRKYRSRWRLKNRLRYLLSRSADFALWEDRRELICGLSSRHERSRNTAITGSQLSRLTNEPDALKRAGLTTTPRQAALPELVLAILKHVDGPVALDDLLHLVADIQGVQEPVVVADIADEQNLGERPSDMEVASSFATEVEQRSYLRRLWAEIIQLPPMQRSALLLNLRDMQEGVIALLPLAGIAGIRQIAEAVEMPAEQFAELWNQLPLEDAAIAKLLDLTRQQVINLRKSARARLARRMMRLDATD